MPPTFGPSSSSSPPFLPSKAFFSGSTNFIWWNSCSSRYSMRSARAPRMVRDHRFPERFVSCLVSGTTCSFIMSPCTSMASCMFAMASFMISLVEEKNFGTSIGSTSTLETFSWLAARCVRLYVVSLRNSFAALYVSHRILPAAMSLSLILRGARDFLSRPRIDQFGSLFTNARARMTSASKPSRLCEHSTSGSSACMRAKKADSRARSLEHEVNFASRAALARSWGKVAG
mmetsp:Transcript_27546/g.59355  ORF Transcript_27546/g.59355 Transcript_27546/m.59355 type:complete len:231 (-) Transcript_27546:820-1512(-)